MHLAISLQSSSSWAKLPRPRVPVWQFVSGVRAVTCSVWFAPSVRSASNSQCNIVTEEHFIIFCFVSVSVMEIFSTQAILYVWLMIIIFQMSTSIWILLFNQYLNKVQIWILSQNWLSLMPLEWSLSKNISYENKKHTLKSCTTLRGILLTIKENTMRFTIRIYFGVKKYVKTWQYVWFYFSRLQYD